jgi:hypothetical protein
MRWSRNWFVVVVLALLVPFDVVRGDVAPRRIDEKFPAMRFDNLADYPDFDFYLLYYHGQGNPYVSPHLMRVQSGETFRDFEGKRRNGGAYLLAVPHGKPLPPMAGEMDRLGKKPTGYLRSAPLDGVYAGSGYLIPYRVQIEGNKLEVTMQLSEWQPGARPVGMLKSLPCVLVLVAYCVVLGWFGARIARRLFPPKPARPADSA